MSRWRASWPGRSTSRASRGCSRRPSNGSGPPREQPGIDDLEQLDAAVRGAYASGSVRAMRMTGFAQSLITIVLFVLILGALVLDPRARPLRHRHGWRRSGCSSSAFGFPPRAKVLRQPGRDALHAQLAADRRVRQARGRGRRRGRRSAIVRGAGCSPGSCSSSSPGVAMNVVLSFVIFTGIALGGDPTIGFRVGHRPARLAGGRGRPADRRRRRQHRRSVPRGLRGDIAPRRPSGECRTDRAPRDRTSRTGPTPT